MNSRSTRRATQSTPALTSIEALLLAQATWEFGAASNNWSAIAKLLSKHPLLSRPKSFFTAQSCHAMYEHLLKEAELELTEANDIPRADTNRSLAERHYTCRFEELREAIVAEESKFKATLKEIEDIRAGLSDTGIQFRPSHESEDGVQDNNLVFSEAVSSPSNRAEGENQRTSQLSDTVLPISGQDIKHPSQWQPEEEEELEKEGENKEEEEENSEGHEYDVDGNENIEHISPKSAVFSMETDSDHQDVVLDGAHTSDVEEPIVQARRSTRQRKSSTVSAIPHLPTRTRLRTRGRTAEENQVESDIDEPKDVSTLDETTSSPFEQSTTRRKDGKRKASLVSGVESPQDRKRAREDSEPLEEEDPGPSVHNTRARTARNTTKSDEQSAGKRFQNVIGSLHSHISQHRNGAIFHHAIKPSEAPNYGDIVKRPMDLKSIKNRVKDGLISNSLEFQRDIYLMFANAMMYNRPGSDVYAMAEDVMLGSEDQINTFRQTDGVLSARRGQR